MTNKLPPAPPAAQSPKGTGDEKAPAAKQGMAGGPPNPDKKGQQGNTAVNTTHQGYQQDR